MARVDASGLLPRQNQMISRFPPGCMGLLYLLVGTPSRLDGTLMQLRGWGIHSVGVRGFSRIDIPERCIGGGFVVAIEC